PAPLREIWLHECNPSLGWRQAMNTHNDQRKFERTPIDNRVQVRISGRVAAYALGINISMGGLLLAAAPHLRVGSPCELAITVDHGSSGKAVVAKAVV